MISKVSIVRSLGRLVARSLGRSIVRSLDRLLDVSYPAQPGLGSRSTRPGFDYSQRLNNRRGPAIKVGEGRLIKGGSN